MENGVGEQERSRIRFGLPARGGRYQDQAVAILRLGAKTEK
jgi:hypothetical protein